MQNLVGNFVAGKPGGIANVGSGLENIKKGDILVIDANTGSVLTGGANTIVTAPLVCIAYAIKDGVPVVTSPIKGSSLTGGGRGVYVAPVMRKASIGYSSVSSVGLPTFTEATDVNGSVVFPTTLRTHPNRQARIDYNVQSATGGYDLAVKIALDVNRYADNNPRVSGKKYVRAITSADGSQANIGTAVTATVVEGSTKVTFSGAHGLAVSDVIYFPNGGVYKVSALVDTEILTLDYAYQGVSEVYAADTAKELTGSAVYGVIFEGILQTRENEVNKYSQPTFSVHTDLDGIEEKEITAFVYGSHTGWQMRDKEVANMGWKGYTDRNDTKRKAFPFQIDLDANYKSLSINHVADVPGDQQQTFEGPAELFLAFDAAADTQLDAVYAILGPWALSGGVDLS